MELSMAGRQCGPNGVSLKVELGTHIHIHSECNKFVLSRDVTTNVDLLLK